MLLEPTDRRRFISTALLGAGATGAILSREEQILQSAHAAAAPQEPEVQIYQGEPLPQGKLGKHSISRLLMGGNLIGGFAHSRDLLYVSRLLRAYNTDEKILETFALAEQGGINTIQLNPSCYGYVERYRKERDGKLQAISCTTGSISFDDDLAPVRDEVQELAERGVIAIYTHGMTTDRCVMNGKIDQIAKVIDLIKAAGVPAGIGSHSLETPIAAEKLGIPNDFYVKTLHPDNYWSASPKEARDEWCWYRPVSQDHDGYHDNIFCVDPERTIEVFSAIDKPWFAFKVMAAGAVTPQVGFNFAYKGGADFVIAGMFDFQVAANVEVAVKALKRSDERARPWRA